MVHYASEKDVLGNIFSIQNESEYSNYSNKYRNEYIPFALAQKEYGQLLIIMDKEKLYLDPDLSLDVLTQKMELKHRNMLSQLINQFSGSNFNDFINYYRIEEAKRIIIDRINKGSFIKMWRISFESGFNSVSTFYRVFKRLVGCTPQEYKSIVKCKQHEVELKVI